MGVRSRLRLSKANVYARVEQQAVLSKSLNQEFEWQSDIKLLVRPIRNNTAYFTLERHGFLGFLRLIISEALH